MGSEGSKPSTTDQQRRKDYFKTVNSQKFTTERQTEERVIIWEIKDFNNLLQSKCCKNRTTNFQFTAGESLKQSSIWRLQLCFTPEKKICLFLRLEKSHKPGKSIHARFGCSVMGQTSGITGVCFAGIHKYEPLQLGFGFGEFATLANLRNIGALTNDTLTIRVKIIIYEVEEINTNTTPASAQEIIKQNAMDVLAKHVADIFQTGEGSDFVICVRKMDSEEYIEKKVHRNILSARSPVFKAMMESPMLEKESGVVTIEDLSPKGLEVFLEFIYTGDIRDDWKLVPEEIVNAAEKYQFPLLKTYCDDWLHTACTPENAFTLLSLAKRQELSKASKNISEYIKSNVENVMSTI